LDEVSRYARRHPVSFMAIAAGLGMLVGRVARSVKDAGSDDGDSSAASSASLASAPVGTTTPTGGGDVAGGQYTTGGPVTAGGAPVTTGSGYVEGGTGYGAVGGQVPTQTTAPDPYRGEQPG